MKPRCVILGGGVCGLYAAHRALELGSEVELFEKRGRFGGLASGHYRGKNWYDLGVHMLHSFDREVFETCATALGDERIEVPLRAHIKWGEKLYHYPLRGRDILAGIPPITLVRCVLGLFLSEIEARFGKRKPGDDAEAALIELYGAPLYEFFFRDFTHRYWGVHPRELSAEFVRRKMPRLSAVDVLRNALEKLRLARPRDKVEGALRFETLHYSITGCESLPRKLAEALQQRGAILRPDQAIQKIHHDGGRILNVTTSDGEHNVADSVLVSTIPLPDFVRALDPAPPDDILVAADHLRYKSMTVYAFLVRKTRCMDALYTYYRNRSFHRVGEPKNAGLRVIPEDHTTLIVETTCEPDDEKWTGEALPRILADLEAEGLCRPEEIFEHHLLHSSHAYPVFSRGFEPYLSAVQQWLAGFENLRSTGRQGGFSYPNMHAAMRMGAVAVEELLRD